MNKHTRLAVGILVLVLVLLIVATVSFSVNISKKSAGSLLTRERIPTAMSL